MKPWSMKEIIFLQENYEIMQGKDIAEKLDRSVKSIRTKAYDIGLSKNKRRALEGLR